MYTRVFTSVQTFVPVCLNCLKGARAKALTVCDVASIVHQAHDAPFFLPIRILHIYIVLAVGKRRKNHDTHDNLNVKRSKSTAQRLFITDVCQVRKAHSQEICPPSLPLGVGSCASEWSACKI